MLVTTDWLAAHLEDPGVRVVDVRWSLLEPSAGRREYEAGHVPGAVFLDVDADLAAPRGEGLGRHPLPRVERFAEVCCRAGIGPSTHVVAYDAGGGGTAARLWWLLRWLGHERVSLLDGGLARWTGEGRPLEAGTVSPPRATFVARARTGLTVDADALERWRRDPATLVIDSRIPERYEGRTEPVDPVAGHVPGARNHPLAENLRGVDDPRFRAPAELRERFAALGAGQAGRVVCYCGSGVNACQNLFALELAGFGNGLLYEGSWSDWCGEPGRPVARGERP